MLRGLLVVEGVQDEPFRVKTPVQRMGIEALYPL